MAKFDIWPLHQNCRCVSTFKRNPSTICVYVNRINQKHNELERWKLVCGLSVSTLGPNLTTKFFLCCNKLPEWNLVKFALSLSTIETICELGSNEVVSSSVWTLFSFWKSCKKKDRNQVWSSWMPQKTCKKSNLKICFITNV